MAIQTVRHRLLYVKDVLQGTIYAALSNARWLTALTPMLALVIRPLLGLTLTTLALLQTWSFWHASHKNLDAWLTTISGLGAALLNNVAAFGGFIARIQGVPFAAAPWFFVAGFTVGAVYQSLMALINARRAYESPTQRQHYLQSAAHHSINAVQLTSCAIAIVLFNLFPAYSLLVTAFAGVVVSVNLGNCVWRFLSSDIKKEIKSTLGMEKPEQKSKSVIGSEEVLQKPPEGGGYRFFTTCDHKAVIENKDPSESKKYLQSYIHNKLLVLERRSAENKRIKQKINVLKLLQQAIENEKAVDKGKLHKRYPRAADTFLCEKSDTDQLIEAVVMYHHQCIQQNGTRQRP